MRHAAMSILVILSACNKAPEGLVVAVGPEGAKTTDALDLDVVEAAVDPNKRDGVGMSVTWFKDDAEQPDLADLWSVPSNRTQKGQVWTASVVATDSVLTSEPATATITIENSLPIVSLSISSKAPKTDADLVASFTTTDADGDTVDVVYSWTVDGGATDITTDTVPADQTGKGQVWEVTAVPSDGEDAGESASIDSTIRNTVPSVRAARTDPTTIRKDTVASCVGAAWSDADPEDPETYEVVWRVNGGIVSTDPTIDGTLFDRGDDVICEITPVDDESAGDPVASAPVTVRNTGPMAIGVALDPVDPTTIDDLEATLTGFEDIDGDGAVAVYAWFVDDTLVSDASFLRHTEFEKGQEVFVRVTGYDGLDYGTPRFAVAIIANSAPTAPVAALPEAAGDGDTLVCGVAAASEDADGDSVSYTVTWTVDGVAYTGGVFTTTWPGDTVPSSDTVVGETWECTITPDDGEDAGPAASDSVLVEAS